MAKAPKKSQDPTEAALSAIEEALQLGKDEKPAESAETAVPIETADEQDQSRLQRRLSAAAPAAVEKRQFSTRFAQSARQIAPLRLAWRNAAYG